MGRKKIDPNKKIDKRFSIATNQETIDYAGGDDVVNAYLYDCIKDRKKIKQFINQQNK